jgi:hypothetical protein
VYFATVSGYPGIAEGGAGTSLQVQPPPSPLSWITGAIESAISGMVADVLGVIESALTLIGQFIFGVISYALTLPTTNGVVENIYNELIQISLSLSLLFLAGSVAYNALKSNYTDLIDIASDLFYKIGVWLFFTFGGLEIYNYVAAFINSLIYEVINPYLPLVTTEVASGAGILTSLAIAGNFVPFDFGGVLIRIISDLVDALIFFAMLVNIRYFLILAIVALIPLLATLWLFEWTRGVAGMLIDVLVGLILAGLLNTIILVLIVTSPISFLFILLPFIADLGTLISLAMSLMTIKPHERLSYSPKKVSPQSTQAQPQPQSQPTPSPAPVQQGNKPSPITYI